jgi:hypothetical protein
MFRLRMQRSKLTYRYFKYVLGRYEVVLQEILVAYT